MNLTYRFTYKDGHIFVESNAVFDGLDFLNLLASDIDSPEKFRSFRRCVDTRKAWWNDATRVEFTNSDCVVIPAFEWPGEFNISIQSLNEFLIEFKKKAIWSKAN